MKTFRSINPELLPKHFEAEAIEKKLDARWESEGTYRFDPSRTREETFVVDTPPPTVSGSLHVGHIFSYTHTDVIARQQRMLGKNIFYPMGWDDNGLPTERRVQNYFNVRADVRTPHEPGLRLEPATAESSKQPPRTVSRPNFIELCHQVTQQDEQVFKGLFRRIGLSVDWAEEYATIDDDSRKLAQLSFLDLYEKGHAYSVKAPTMWDVDFQTAVAQAEVEDRPQAGAFHDIEFGVEGSDARFTIATTRPELLAACVGVTAHPDDERYKGLFGKRAITPLFRVPVPIFPSELADPTKGTGILMVCTFGDATDVLWWRQQKLPLRQIIGRNGRLMAVTFGDSGWESLDAPAAQGFYAGLLGKTVKQARTAMVELLRREDGAAKPGMGVPLQGEPKPIQREVKFFEKGDQPLEFISTRQWFVRLMDKKDQLLRFGDRVKWHPEHMGSRYRNWTENLQLDWCISRQRYFGVQFPVWYPLDADGNPLHDEPIVATREQIPVDPTVDVPTGYEASQRDQPNGFTAESDVFDTWFTSSLTPQIASGWELDPERHGKLFPADIRPQSHEIIRTWAFYTIAKAMLHENSIPWKHVLISGWILDPDRKKMSKSKGNVITPMHLLENYGADAVRYWSASARLGTDTAFDEKVFKVGKRLVTKLFNAGKYVLSQTAQEHPITHELDRAFVAKLAEVVETATASYKEFEFAPALANTESFFWASFTDTYLELVKARARGEGSGGEEARGSAVAALRLGLNVLLRLFAPVLPYITEEVWSWAFAEETGRKSIHRARWPDARTFAGIEKPANPASFAIAEAAQQAINKRKSESGAGVGRGVTRMKLAANAATLAGFGPVREDVLSATRSQGVELVEKADLADGTFEIQDFELAPAAEKEKAPEASEG
ncbi:MAG TPA: valine--tRNA ligase [Archangium sp.]|uniref:valine--tRNA ligase n=1 Tax=Archangium sp. TaxID=1872627 RepID=UPI002E34238B|nr:valine--tRNA ligase [Archangium sp.]HEX5747405.1 valine--tRNA ligase [Archangium sp.]